MRCLHTNIAFSSLGGVQAILRAHHEHDASIGLDSRFLVYLEPADPHWPRARFVNFAWDWSLRRTRQAIRSQLADFTPEVAVYHTTLAMPFLADLDRSPKRILYLHGPLPVLREQLTSRLYWVDGVLAVSDELVELVHSVAPHFGPDRIQRVFAPIFPVPVPVDLSRPAHQPLVLGYSGRLQIHDKRVERLSELCRRLDSSGLEYRFEVLGEGPERATLEKDLPDRRRVIFHGVQSGEAYWRILAGWDAIVFFSDREGTPVAQLEAMSLGIVPVVPAVNSGADAYARAVDPGLIYPIGDVPALEQIIRRLQQDGIPWAHWRKRCREAIAVHDSNQYLRSFAEFVARIQALPSAPRRPFPAQPFPVGFLPLSALAPLAEWRRKLRRITSAGRST